MSSFASSAFQTQAFSVLAFDIDSGTGTFITLWQTLKKEKKKPSKKKLKNIIQQHVSSIEVFSELLAQAAENAVITKKEAIRLDETLISFGIDFKARYKNVLEEIIEEMRLAEAEEDAIIAFILISLI